MSIYIYIYIYCQFSYIICPSELLFLSLSLYSYFLPLISHVIISFRRSIAKLRSLFGVLGWLACLFLGCNYYVYVHFLKKLKLKFGIIIIIIIRAPFLLWFMWFHFDSNIGGVSGLCYCHYINCMRTQSDPHPFCLPCPASGGRAIILKWIGF